MGGKSRKISTDEAKAGGIDVPAAIAGPTLSGASVSGGVLGRLEGELAAEGGKRTPPVELWNPPYCGDIGLAIARDGTWSYRGSPIGRMPLVQLFASVLRRDEDGRHYLVTPVEKVDVAVEDAPFLAVEMEVVSAGREQTLILRTNLDDVVRVGSAHPLGLRLAANGGLKPYVLVRGRLEALLTRALTYDLAELMVSDDEGRLGLWSAGAFFTCDAAPGGDVS